MTVGIATILNVGGQLDFVISGGPARPVFSSFLRVDRISASESFHCTFWASNELARFAVKN
jgi:hypothetical protein